MKWTEEALKLVESAVHDCYKNVVALQTDPDLASIRSHPTFAKVLEKVKGNP